VTVIVLLITLILIVILGLVKQSRDIKSLQRPDVPETIPPPIYIDTEGLERRIKDVPSKVLQSIQGSINTHKGALGELIAYLELRGKYDRIIPLGNIVDFICIRLPKDDDPGCVDFVDIKTGNSSRLNKDQRLLKDLIDNHRISFTEYRIVDSKIAGND